MKACFYDQNSYAVIIKNDSDYIVFQKFHSDDDMESLGEIIRSKKVINISIKKDKFKIHWSDEVVWERDIFLKTQDVNTAVSEMNNIKQFI